MKITTKEYIDRQVQAMMHFTEQGFESVKEAVDKVEKTNSQKFEAQNEWRQQFKDQTAVFLTRREFWGAIIGIILAMAAIYFKK